MVCTDNGPNRGRLGMLAYGFTSLLGIAVVDVLHACCDGLFCFAVAGFPGSKWRGVIFWE